MQLGGAALSAKDSQAQVQDCISTTQYSCEKRKDKLLGQLRGGAQRLRGAAVQEVNQSRRKDTAPAIGDLSARPGLMLTPT